MITQIQTWEKMPFFNLIPCLYQTLYWMVQRQGKCSGCPRTHAADTVTRFFHVSGSARHLLQVSFRPVSVQGVCNVQSTHYTQNLVKTLSTDQLGKACSHCAYQPAARFVEWGRKHSSDRRYVLSKIDVTHMCPVTRYID